MIVGVPKEIKSNENRVAITPAGVETLVQAGHSVFIETGAGAGAGFEDAMYQKAGGAIVHEARELFQVAEMILKVKEPLPPEYDYLREGQLLFTYLHLAPDPQQTRALLDKKVIGIAYETIELENGSLPLLTPMSEIAGRMAVQIGARFLEKPQGGKGLLLGGVPGVSPGHVVILGGGVVGNNAAKMAVGLGARVTILDINPARLRYLDDIYSGRVETVVSSSYSIREVVKTADLLVGAVLIPGARTPRLVTEEMVRGMPRGSVIVDVAIDQGGCVETIDRVTTHSEPVYEKYGVIHYSVANMPGAVPRSSTLALTNATLPYALELADKGWVTAVKENPALARGVNVALGKITYKAVAEAMNAEYYPLESVLDRIPV